jgi:hypothetical protein
MSAGYANNPYVLNVVPLFGTASSSSGDGAGFETVVNVADKTLSANQIGTYDSGTVQFTSPVLIDVGGVIVQLQAKIAELEARIAALGG